MAISANDFNILELIDSQQLTANLLGDTNNPSKAGDKNDEASKMLDILQLIRADMQSMNARIDTLEKNREPQEETIQSQSDASPLNTTNQPQSDSSSRTSTRWADHMDGVNVPMFTDPRGQWDEFDEEDDEDKENLGGTKLFTVSQDNETFLKHHFAMRIENGTRRQWREKHGAPKLPATACPKLDKIMKQSLSSQTKFRDKQLSKTQALVLDAVGPLASILETATKGKLTEEMAVEAVQTALKLLGNASCHLAAERRRNVLTDLNPTLKEMADEDKLFKDAAPNLFGEGFSKKAKERDDELKVLRNTRHQPKKNNTGWKGKENQFFPGRRSYAQATRGGGAFRGHNRYFNRPRPYPARGRPQTTPQNQN